MSTPTSPAYKADPKRPYKALVAALAAAILVALRDYFAAGNETSWAGLLSALVSAVITFIVTYLVRNPVAGARRTGV